MSEHLTLDQLQRRFSFLLDRCRSQGFSVGVDTYVTVHSLIQSLHQRGDLPRNPVRLCAMTAPLVCTNERELVRFEATFRDFWPKGAQAFRPKKKAEELPEVEIDEKPLQHKWLWLLALVAIIALGALFIPPDPDDKTDPVQTVDSGAGPTTDDDDGTDGNGGDTKPEIPDIGPVPEFTPISPRLSAAWQKGTKDILAGYQAQSLSIESKKKYDTLANRLDQLIETCPSTDDVRDPTQKERVDAWLQQYRNLEKDIDAFQPESKFSQADQTRLAEAVAAINLYSRSIPDPGVDEGRFLSFYRTWFVELRLGLTLLLPLIFAFWLVHVWRRRLPILRKHATSGEATEKPLHVKGDSAELFDSRQLRAVVGRMGLHLQAESEALDPEKTVQASIENFGLFTPQTAEHRVSPEYLVLVDRRGYRDQGAMVVDCLLHRLEDAGIFLEIYYFSNDARILTPRDSKKRVRLADLAYHHEGHRLLIFSDGASMLNPFSKALRNWITVFENWPERTLLTPQVHEGRRERLLAETGMNVVPASEAGLAHLLALQEDSPWPKHQADGGLFPARFVMMEEEWLRRAEPEPELRRQMILALRDYLGEGFDWLCACAVYPAVDWHLTLHLGKALKDKVGHPLITENRLTALCRLPWFRHGHMPDWFRFDLLEALDSGREADVRRVINHLLAHPDTEGFDLRIADGRSLLTQDEDDNPLRDQVFLEIIVGRPNKLAVMAPKFLARWLFPEGNYRLGFKPWMMGLLAVIPALLVWLVMQPLAALPEPINLPTFELVNDERERPKGMPDHLLFAKSTQILGELLPGSGSHADVEIYYQMLRERYRAVAPLARPYLPLKPLQEKNGNIFSVAMNPSGTHVAFVEGSNSRDLIIWEKGKDGFRSLASLPYSDSATAYFLDNQRVAVYNGTTLSLFHVNSGEPLLEKTDDLIAWHAGFGKIIFIPSSRRTLEILGVTSGQSQTIDMPEVLIPQADTRIRSAPPDALLKQDLHESLRMTSPTSFTIRSADTLYTYSIETGQFSETAIPYSDNVEQMGGAYVSTDRRPLNDLGFGYSGIEMGVFHIQGQPLPKTGPAGLLQRFFDIDLNAESRIEQLNPLFLQSYPQPTMLTDEAGQYLVQFSNNIELGFLEIFASHDLDQPVYFIVPSEVVHQIILKSSKSNHLVAKITAGSPPFTFSWEQGGQIVGDKSDLVATGTEENFTSKVRNIVGEEALSWTFEAKPEVLEPEVEITYDPLFPEEGNKITFTASVMHGKDGFISFMVAPKEDGDPIPLDFFTRHTEMRSDNETVTYDYEAESSGAYTFWARLVLRERDEEPLYFQEYFEVKADPEAQVAEPLDFELSLGRRNNRSIYARIIPNNDEEGRIEWTLLQMNATAPYFTDEKDLAISVDSLPSGGYLLKAVYTQGDQSKTRSYSFEVKEVDLGEILLSNEQPKAGEAITLSTSNNIPVQWNYGDRSTNTTEKHTYASPGLYTIQACETEMPSNCISREITVLSVEPLVQDTAPPVQKIEPPVIERMVVSGNDQFFFTHAAYICYVEGTIPDDARYTWTLNEDVVSFDPYYVLGAPVAQQIYRLKVVVENGAGSDDAEVRRGGYPNSSLKNYYGVKVTKNPGKRLESWLRRKKPVGMIVVTFQNNPLNSAQSRVMKSFVAQVFAHPLYKNQVLLPLDNAVVTKDEAMTHYGFDIYSLWPDKELLVRGDTQPEVYDLHNRWPILPNRSTQPKPPNETFSHADQVPAHLRGDVARTLLYMHVRYKRLSLDKTLCTMVDWHREDPPDGWDFLRNNRVQQEMDIRNPFVDYPEWVDDLFGRACGTK